MLTYIFRKPKYPIICDIDGHIIGAKSEKSFLKQMNEIQFIPEKTYNLIDISGEGWWFTPDKMAVSPLSMRKWFKKDIITLYNNRKNSIDGMKYSVKSTSSKRFDKIFRDIVELLLKP